jgi:FrmR/RcnR family transcriptional regulator, repressor of rcnA expression
MNGISTTTERRNQHVSARLRRIQGQIVALERSLASEPEFTVFLQRAAAARGAMSGLIADLMEERPEPHLMRVHRSSKISPYI